MVGLGYDIESTFRRGFFMGRSKESCPFLRLTKSQGRSLDMERHDTSLYFRGALFPTF
jgi:hypothetical protein